MIILSKRILGTNRGTSNLISEAVVAPPSLSLLSLNDLNGVRPALTATHLADSRRNKLDQGLIECGRITNVIRMSNNGDRKFLVLLVYHVGRVASV